MAPKDLTRQSRPRRGRWSIVALIAMIGLLASPAAALAQQGPTGNQYDPLPEQIEQAVVGDDTVPTEADRVVSVLPFTGLDLALLGAAAMLLGVAGLTLRRFTRISEDKR